MTSKILVCWIGGIDWNASEGVRNVGLGPIGQAVQEGDYEQIFLLNNYKNKKSQNYKSWLQNLTSAKITIEEFHHLNPINYEEIYKAATKVLSEITNSISDAKLTFHLSPGTPAMTAIWIILAKTRFKANLIQSSKEAGVQTADIPFEISAEFMPDLLRRSDSELKRLAAGLPSKTPEFGEIIHRSEEMKNVIHKAWLVAQHSSIPILLQGES
jgi:transcriptional regulator with GAF, ATPase, and Fis domain